MQLDAVAPPPIPDVTLKPKPIAPWAHTVALFVVLLVTAAMSQQRAASIAESTMHWTRYGSSVMLSWLLLGAVVAGIYQRGDFFARAFQGHASTWAHELGLGAAVYLCGLMAMASVAIALQHTPLAHTVNEALVLALLPHTPGEFAAWLVLSVSAGFCEELIFRGYLLQQISAWTQKPMLAVVLSSVIFGSVHLYEGLGAMLPLMTLALLFGMVTLRRNGDLRAVMFAHALQDFLVACFALARPWMLRHQGHP